MAATAILNDVPPSSVPTLKVTSDGNNFPIFSLCFLASVDAKGYLGHFDGTDPRPTFAIAPLTQAQAEDLTVWDKAERNSKALILQRVPDSVALLLNPMLTVADIRTFARKFLQLKCPASGNVREFLDNLLTRRKELSTLGVIISEDDFHSTIIGCLPQYLSGFASSQLSAAKLFSSTGTIPCSPFMTAIRRCMIERRVSASGVGRERTNGMGMRCWQRWTRGERQTPWHLLELRHERPLRARLQEAEKPKDSTLAAKTSNGTAAAVDWDSESEGAWAVNIASDSDESEMPELQPVSDSEDGSMPDLQTVVDSDDESDGGSTDSDWFSEVGEDGGERKLSCGSPEELSEVDRSERGSFIDVDSESDSVELWDYVRDALSTATQDKAAAVTQGQELHSATN
ncbi:hypothetical protein B0H14DRAFT_3613792 [Mycena olivaceomarginata]|nr:hypothetical protein B0H14DRAFT_3613792 [Mycena olivaceomarginata]